MNFNEVYKKIALLEKDGCSCGPDCECGGDCGPNCNCGPDCGSKVEEAKKKPDADGDGVPDWADKKPGKDDNEEVDEGYGKKKKVAEAQINLSITDLNSTDAETLSQMLHLAGVAEQPAPAMGGIPGDLPPVPAEDPYHEFSNVGGDYFGGPEDVPTPGDELGMSAMDALSMDMPEPDMDMDMEPEIPSDDYDAGFDAEMDAPMSDPEPDMEIEPADDVDVEMTPDDEAVIMSDDLDINELLSLSGMDALPEAEEDKMWDNEPDEESHGDITDMPGEGIVRKQRGYKAAAGGDNPMAIKERAEKLRKKLDATMGLNEGKKEDEDDDELGDWNDKGRTSKLPQDQMESDDKDDVAESMYQDILTRMRAAVERK